LSSSRHDKLAWEWLTVGQSNPAVIFHLDARDYDCNDRRIYRSKKSFAIRFESVGDEVCAKSSLMLDEIAGLFEDSSPIDYPFSRLNDTFYESSFCEKYINLFRVIEGVSRASVLSLKRINAFRLRLRSSFGKRKQKRKTR
jgi:hypothetical protein